MEIGRIFIICWLLYKTQKAAKRLKPSITQINGQIFD